MLFSDWISEYLGQMADFTALIGIERTQPKAIPPKVKIIDKPDELKQETTFSAAMGNVTTTTISRPKFEPKRTLPKNFIERLKSRFYIVRGIKRFGLNTKYDEVIDYLMEASKVPPLNGGTLAIDYTGVGVGVVDVLVRYKPKCTIVPIMITAGTGASIRANGYGSAFSGFNVSKKELVSLTNMVLQSRRIRFEEGQPLAKILADELQNFKYKVTSSANETFESWREREHDDLVLSLSICLWAAERGLQQYWLR